MSLIVDDLGHSYSDRWVFRHVNCCFADDSSIAIVGPSGVGKTTFISLVGGLIKAQEGSVRVRTAASEAPPAPSDIAWVLQTTNAFPNRSTHANIAAPMILRGWSKTEADRAAQVALARVGLESSSDEPARHLSGGELQRLSIARAVAMRAPIVIADEPTGQLDDETTRHVLDLLTAGRHHPSLLIVVTHDPIVAAACDQQWRLGADGLRL
ncbi:MAG: ATP-binding cassette domain-containing protein [Ilumatobacteraceae bacterium]